MERRQLAKHRDQIWTQHPFVWPHWWICFLGCNLELSLLLQEGIATKFQALGTGSSHNYPYHNLHITHNVSQVLKLLEGVSDASYRILRALVWKWKIILKLLHQSREQLLGIKNLEYMFAVVRCKLVVDIWVYFLGVLPPKSVLTAKNGNPHTLMQIPKSSNPQKSLLFWYLCVFQSYYCFECFISSILVLKKA